MKRFYPLLLIILLLSMSALAQTPKPTPKTIKKPPVVKTAANEKEEFDKAAAAAAAPERIAALQKFITDFPNSKENHRALELIVSGRAEIAENKLRGSETEEGVKFFILAASEAPKPISEELFAKVILQFPTNLFFRGQQKAALEVAKIIEEKADGNARQLIALATFYLGVENAEEAKRLAEKAIALGANLPIESQTAAYQTLGLANRLNFDLEGAANAYAKALELNPNSLVSRRSLAEMKRATGKISEAAALYREILEKDAADTSAQTGLILSLFDAEKQTEAEAELAKALEANPNNLFLLVGAAYWYAAHRETEKAVDLAQKAVALEPRYTWAHIALARALILQKRPLEAEKTLLTARQYGNFPTLDYELASARMAAGFYEEAVYDLRRSFEVTNGAVRTRLGNRVVKDAKTFIELLAAERRASIFEPLAADNLENAEKLKSLLNLSQKLSAKELNETEIGEAADEFVKGDDSAKTHRQLYAASRLLQKKIALPKILELTQAAVKGVDSSLEVSAPSASVLADELFDTRTIAISRGQLVIVPDLPRQTLSNIVRGRIEEIAGWTLYQQEKPLEAGIRLKRAVGILPEKSAWWRSSMWRLGASLEAGGKPVEALDAYIKSYISGEPDASKRTAIEALYLKINGTIDGLEEKVGAKPKPVASFLIKQPETSETVAKVMTSPTPAVETTPVPTPAPTVEATPRIEETVRPEITPAPVAEKLPTMLPEQKPTPEPTPAATPTPTAETTPEMKPEPTPEVKPIPTPETSSIPEPTPKTTSEKTVKITDSLEKPVTATKTVTDVNKPLFDPVIIKVPKTDAAKPKSEPTEEKSAETVKIEEPNSETQAKMIEEKPKPVDPLTAGEQRPQVIVTENYPSESAICTLLIGQTNISLINGGGSIGLLVGYSDGEGDVSKITAASSSATDISVALEPDIGKQSNRAFFVVKSISRKTGIFTVTFDSPCGKKEVQVKVR